MNKDNYRTLSSIERWMATARNEVENIGVWRVDGEHQGSGFDCLDAPNIIREQVNDRTFHYWAGEKLPETLLIDTSIILDAIATADSMFNPGPIQDIAEAVELWHRDRTAAGIVRQSELDARLRKAIDTLVALGRKLSSPTDQDASIQDKPRPLVGTLADAAAIITDEPGLPGKTIAARLGITGEHFRRSIVPELKQHGFYNKDGYRPPA